MFCGIQRQIKCFLNSDGITNLIEGSMIDEIELRRFGLSASGTVLEFDDFGDPTNINDSQTYYSLTFKAKVEMKTEENDESSNAGGISSPKEYMLAVIPLDLEIYENDILIYPIGSNDAYRVRSISLEQSKKRRTIKSYREFKSIK